CRSAACPAHHVTTGCASHRQPWRICRTEGGRVRSSVRFAFVGHPPRCWRTGKKPYVVGLYPTQTTNIATSDMPKGLGIFPRGNRQKIWVLATQEWSYKLFRMM